MFSKNPLEFLVCGFGTNRCLKLDARVLGNQKTKKIKDRPLKFGVGMKIPKLSYLDHL